MAPTHEINFLEDIPVTNKEFCHSFDYVAVLPIKDKRISEEAHIFLEELSHKEFQTYCFLSIQENELFVLFHAPLHQLQAFATAIKYRMELDPLETKKLCENGFPESKIKPFSINSDPKYSTLDPYQYLYGRYDPCLPMATYRKSNHTTNPFRQSIRLKLIYYMIQASTHEGGMHYPIEKMLRKKKILALYPLHDPNSIELFTKTWIHHAIWLLPWYQPLNHIREYFGEKIALYFSFMGFYTQALLIPAIIGLGCQLVVWITNDWSHPVIPIYSLIISLWVVIFLELWKRKEKDFSLKWGTHHFEEEEPIRPEFKGEPIISYINGKPLLYFPDTKKTILQLQSSTIINLFAAIIIGVVSGIYILRFHLYISIGGHASIVASALNSIQIILFNMIYRYLAIYLTNYENHKFATDYDDSLITKLFIFQFINSYSSFYFLAFIAPYLPRPPQLSDDGPEGNYIGECGASDCMIPLSINLGIIFFTNLTINNVIEAALPFIMNWFTKKSETHGTYMASGVKLSLPEKEFLLQKYDVSMNTLQEYAETAVQFGLMTIFISALPIATCLAFIYNCFEIRLDAWKLLTVYQRPIPKIAEDWGAWEKVFSILGMIGVITNAGLICFTMKTLDNWSYAERLWIFIGYQWTLFTLMYLISTIIPNESSEYRIQLQRSEWILSKLIDRVPDNDDGEEGEEGNEAIGKKRLNYENDDEDEYGHHGFELSSHVILQSNPMYQSSELIFPAVPTNEEDLLTS